jgi:hypothetical protein
MHKCIPNSKWNQENRIIFDPNKLCKDFTIIEKDVIYYLFEFARKDAKDRIVYREFLLNNLSQCYVQEELLQALSCLELKNIVRIYNFKKSIRVELTEQSLAGFLYTDKSGDQDYPTISPINF